MSYKTFTQDMAMLFLFEYFDEHTKEFVDREFKRRYPGNYSVEWFLAATNQIDYKMTFDTPEDEVMFALKYL